MVGIGGVYKLHSERAAELDGVSSGSGDNLAFLEVEVITSGSKSHNGVS